jgi:hypothetical protein
MTGNSTAEKPTGVPLAAALAARDAACGHLSNELVAKALAAWAWPITWQDWSDTFTADEIAALRAATFKVTE